jgi:rhomboid protease GluP
MFRRQRTGAVVCPSCGRLVGVNDKECLNCGRRNPGMWGLTKVLRGLGRDAGFVQLVMGAAILLYGASLFVDVQGIHSSGLSFLVPSNQSLFAFGAAGAVPVLRFGRWWTLLSAGWLHAGLLHILFNLMWVRQLAPETAELYGPSRMVIIYTVSGVTGFLLSSLLGSSFTVGASASIFGLLAALVHYGRRGGSSHIGSQAWSYAIVLFIMGFFFPGVDNWAHLGGFAGGYLVSRWLDPLLPERSDHVLAAVICLGASGLAIAASLLTFYLR